MSIREIMRTSMYGLAIAAILGFGFIVHSESKTESRGPSMMAGMKTYCVGRFQVSVPARSRVVYRDAFISGWNIGWKMSETDEGFAERVRSREKSLSQEMNERGGESLERSIQVAHEMGTGKILLHSRITVEAPENGRQKVYTGASLEAHVRVGKISIIFSSDVHDTEDIAELSRLIKQIRPLREQEVPLQAGFCFGPAIIIDPLVPGQNERVTMFMSLDGHPDVAFSFFTAAGLKPSQPLLERQKTNEIRQQFSWAFKTIRSGNRVVAGIAGQEAADGIRELNGKATHDFTWESFSDENDLYKPEISIELSTGHPPRAGSKSPGSSLTDDEVIQLWDTILASVHVRPVEGGIGR